MKYYSIERNYVMDELQKHVKTIEPDTREHILYDSIYITFPKKGKFIEKKSRPVVAWSWGSELGLTVK